MVIEFEILVCVLLVITIGVIIEYYRRFREVHREYEKARGVVEDIVISFNKQLRREAEIIEQVAYKVEAVSSKGERAVKVAEEAYKKGQSLERKIDNLGNFQELSAKLDTFEKKLNESVASQEKLCARVSALEEQIAQFSSSIPEARGEAVIPIKKERVLAPLTETELSVLEMLAQEGPKTAPEIKDRIKLSREHTARLMKKLYEEGYLERDDTKIPFKYKVKKEMEDILKKTETT